MQSRVQHAGKAHFNEFQFATLSLYPPKHLLNVPETVKGSVTTEITKLPDAVILMNSPIKNSSILMADIYFASDLLLLNALLHLSG